MRKYIIGLSVISIFIFAIAWGVMGLKLLDGDYDITVCAYVGVISLILFFVSFLYLKFTRRCSHCGKIIQSDGTYCPHCGNKIEE